MQLIDKLMYQYTGELSPGEIVAWQDSLFTIACGVVVDIEDVSGGNAQIMVSELSMTMIEVWANDPDIQDVADDIKAFIADTLSLIGHPLHTIQESQIRHIPQTKEAFANVHAAINKCSAAISEATASATAAFEELP